MKYHKLKAGNNNMNRSENKIKQCFWCGSLDKENNHVSISEDVPPRWLSGEKKVRKSNCVPQCNECKNALALLDDSVVGYFNYGPGIDLEKIEGSNNFVNNKGLYARKINLYGNNDYAQANGCLLLWLRKLLVGLWYKEQETYFDGGMFLLAHWLTFDDAEMYISGVVTPTQVTINLLFDIDDEITGNDYLTEFYKKTPFDYTFVPSSRSGVPFPLQLLRFSIYGSFAGYCMYLPKFPIISPSSFSNMFGKPPYHLEKWIKGYPYFSPSTVVTLVNSIKNISAEEAAKRVRL